MATNRTVYESEREVVKLLAKLLGDVDNTPRGVWPSTATDSHTAVDALKASLSEYRRWADKLADDLREVRHAVGMRSALNSSGRYESELGKMLGSIADGAYTEGETAGKEQMTATIERMLGKVTGNAE